MSNELISIEEALLALQARIAALHEAIASGQAALYRVKRVMDTNDLCALANEELRERSRRTAHFPAMLLGEPAWDILLDLYCHSCRRQEVSVTSACLAARVPVTTGLRWVGLLESGGFIARRPSKKDRRAVILDLTADGRSRIEQILTERFYRRSLAPLCLAGTDGSGSQEARELTEKLLITQPSDPAASL